ncbi:MAG: arsenate reductase (glutaredoxin) [Planctomycetes bacterium]|nr:arsenate reductase (glutaredoxin) [Planctomycetota bacterium]MCB9906181.1 arsenate reductase (glutaredoxin) [Planctomycetota bacterium]MCB9911145.1 arsenate reductase (glutaredoxin) [Planctomycetota bacterium]HPF13607.1 arsenate reductase (glutaredoxin) [Planctomycetota bacterium]HRV80797.1 arsenate reductase (glutaredoxin) [Planctomycetota bacterium]
MTLPTDGSLCLLHNPTCSKSQAARAWLRDQGVAVELRNYLTQPLDGPEIRDLAQRLGLPPQDWVRSHDLLESLNGLHGEQALDHVEAALLRDPGLLQRPIAVCGSRAWLARSVEDLSAGLAAARGDEGLGRTHPG